MIPDVFWKRMKNIQTIHRRLYDSGNGWVVGKLILLLTHTGRKTGKTYVTPLQYEKVNGAYVVGAGRGPKADWFRNVRANPCVHVRVGRSEFDCTAEPVIQPERAADFLQYRLKHHPLMIGLMMKFAHGLPMRPSRVQLLELAASTPLVILRPPKEVE